MVGFHLPSSGENTLPRTLIEGVAVIPHEAAGLGDAAKLLGKLEQGELRRVL